MEPSRKIVEPDNVNCLRVSTDLRNKWRRNAAMCCLPDYNHCKNKHCRLRCFCEHYNAFISQYRSGSSTGSSQVNWPCCLLSLLERFWNWSRWLTESHTVSLFLPCAVYIFRHTEQSRTTRQCQHFSAICSVRDQQVFRPGWEFGLSQTVGYTKSKSEHASP